ncbi:cupin domain-containing protein [Bosea sp. TAF32]|uniref:cupin domain-containing protein n=1 Tax=Bosea sp. TAF32 TaxID=3237482 RepID=UPI003F93EB73
MMIDSNALRSGTSRTARFERGSYGSQVSFFLIDNEPGQGPGLHVHPYSETWVIRSGEAEFTLGTEKLRAGAGTIVVGPAGVPHKFVNIGTGRLELVCIHANEAIVQEWIDDDAAA